MLRGMGSRLQLHSAPGEGSCFWFELMVEAAPEAAATPTEAMAGEPLQGLRLVVVDDNPLGRLVAEKQIQRLGAQVVVCDSAEALLEHLADPGPNGAPDAVLMDLHMPEIDGLEATRRLRHIPGCAALPVFALSGAVTPSEIAAAHDVGMLDFIAKPFRATELARAVLRGLRRGVMA
jgi:CheY-like chemotaxis protein